VQYRIPRPTPKTASQGPDLEGKIAPESRSQKRPRLERVNACTFKVTDGTVSRTPSSHGQWAGYNATLAVAWIIDAGNLPAEAGRRTQAAWLARCGGQVCGPSPFAKAKCAAFAMVRGGADDHAIKNPVDHLNGLAIRLLDQAADLLDQAADLDPDLWR